MIIKEFPNKIPPGGYKIECAVCKIKLKTREDNTKAMCHYTARANGWKQRKKGWVCPQHARKQ